MSRESPHNVPTSPFIRPRVDLPRPRHAIASISKDTARTLSSANTTISVDTARNRATHSPNATKTRAAAKVVGPTPSPTMVPSKGATTVNRIRLYSFLSGYDRHLKQKLVQGFAEGFHIPSSYVSNSPIHTRTIALLWIIAT